MGIVLWLAAGVAAFLLGRLVPHGRDRRWVGELALAIIAASLLGLLATAFDFGGWQEAEWRAGLFALLGAFASVGALRLIR